MPYLSALEVCSRQGAIQIHVYLYLYYYHLCYYYDVLSPVKNSNEVIIWIVFFVLSGICVVVCLHPITCKALNSLFVPMCH